MNYSKAKSVARLLFDIFPKLLDAICKFFPRQARWINKHDWIIATIGKHIVPNKALAGGGEGIGVEEAAHLGVVISTLQVVEAGFLVIDISSISQRIDNAEGGGHGAGAGELLAPGIVAITDHSVSGLVQNGYHIALDIGGIVVGCAVIDQGQGLAIRRVGEVEVRSVTDHAQKLTAVVEIAVAIGAVTAGYTQAVCIVGIVPGGGAVLFRHGNKLSAMLPAIGPDTVVQGITNLVVGNIVAVIMGQQVAPGSIAVGVFHIAGKLADIHRAGSVGELPSVFDIAALIVCPHIGIAFFLVVLPDQLVGIIILIGSSISAIADTKDIPPVIIGVGIGYIVAR